MEMFYIVLISSVIVLLFIIYVQNKRIRQLEESFNLVRNGKTSLAVKHGMTMEQLVPWTSLFDGDPRSFRFIGEPIDGILFGNDKITFVEFKTGQAKLSEKQKAIKELIEKKKISWKEVRIS